MPDSSHWTAACALSHAKSFLRSFVDLFDLSAPTRDYSVGIEEDISTAAWKATGRAMRQAIGDMQGARYD